LEKRPLKRSHKKIDPVKLKAYLVEHPDSFLREIADHFDCTDVAVHLAMKRLKITRKKTKEYVERNEKTREEFAEKWLRYPRNCCIILTSVA